MVNLLHFPVLLVRRLVLAQVLVLVRKFELL